ncbi:hypothetical protein G6F56_002748 [Rhizopus delemar]|nr:hypothetical protein G6F56_002748 [Rhizopus delemar]
MIESFTLQSSSASPILDNLVSISSAVSTWVLCYGPELDDYDHYSVSGVSTGTIEGADYSRFVVQKDAIYYGFSQDQASPNRTTLFSGLLYHLSRAHTIPRAYFNKSIKVFNNYVNGIMDPLPSTYSCQKNRKETFPVEAITYVMCRNGCKMFSEEENDSACGWCEAEATKRRRIQNETKRERIDIKYLPLSAQLALILSDENLREQMKLGRSQREELPVEDIANSLLTDGFLPFESKTPSMIIVHFVIWNLPPSIRYELRNMLQPILEELKLLQSAGLATKVPSGEIIQAEVYLMAAFGDMPAVAKMCFHQDHTHKSGCRICRIKAYTQQIADSIIGNCLVFRQDEEAAIIRPESDYFEENIAYGIRRPSMFNCLLLFKDPVYFFGLEIIHLFGHNAGSHFLEMLRGEYGRASMLYLAPSVIQAIGSAMQRSKRNIPKTFSGNFKDISSNSGMYRAVEWLAFKRYVISTLVKEYCSERFILGLVDIFNITLKQSVIYDDLERAERGCEKWFAFLDQSIQDGLLDGSVYTVTHHCLRHIPMMTRKLGPLIRCSSFNLERAIQEYKKHIQSPSNPAANASNVLLDLTVVSMINLIEYLIE